ncbi:MAG TPA: hypothetical protein VFQ53_25655 [Kofleriaceae bacterium]|nr:hypothetical protein [Kofleriaceae bacterium]
MLREGTDYLFFPKAFHSGGALTGLKNAEVSVVATRRYLFLLPVRETTLGLGWVTVRSHWFQGDSTLSVADAVAGFLKTPGLTVEALEADLLAFLPKGEYVVPLDELASLTVWSRFLRQVRFKQRTRRSTQVLALRGKDNHVRFEQFYADAIAQL